jgi:GT2 family glycosyltransferase
MYSVGVGIITCDRVPFYKKCIDSVLDLDRCVTVTVNDGKPFKNMSPRYRPEKYIHNKKNIGVGRSKNKALRYLIDSGCEHIFLLEDDVYIHDKQTLEKYIHAAEVTGIKHLNFCLHGEDNKLNGKPAPKLIVDYKDVQIALYHNIYGALSYYHSSVLEDVGLMDKEYYNAMEHVDHTMQIIQAGYHPPFRWFADIANSHELIHEQDRGHSESKIRDDEEWKSRFMDGIRRFHDKFDINVCNPREITATKEGVVEFLKSVKP